MNTTSRLEHRLPGTALAMAAVTLSFGEAGAQSKAWVGNGNQAFPAAIWGGNANWTPSGPANAANNTATFGNSFNNGYACIVNTNRVIGNVVYNDPANASDFILRTHPSDFTLTFDVTSGLPSVSVAQAGRTLIIQPRIAGNDGLAKDGPGRLVLANGNSLYTGPVAVNGGILEVGGGVFAIGGTDFDVGTAGRVGNGEYTQGITIAAGAEFRYSSSADTTLAGDISGGGALTKGNSGILTLSGTNSHSGGTTVRGGALLAISPAALPGFEVPGQVVFDGGTVSVRVGGGDWTSAQVETLLANAVKTGGALGIDTGNGDFSQWTAFSTANLGPALGLTKLGDNRFTLDQANSYAGATTVRGGTLALAGAGTLGDGSGALVLDGGALDLGGLAATVGAVQIAVPAAGGDTLANGSLTGASYAASNASGNATVAASLLANGSAGFIKTGAGGVTLGGANTYTGTTAVQAGTLRFATTGSATSGVTVAAGAAAGVLVAPGGGQWATSGDLAHADTSTLTVDFGSNTPSTTLAPMKVANLSLGTGLTLRVTSDSFATFTAGQSYPLVTWTGSGPADAAAFETLILAHRVEGNLSVSANTLFLNMTYVAPGPLAWNTGDGDWDTTDPDNWLDSSLAPATYIDLLDKVEFGDAAAVTGNPVVTLASGLSPAAVVMKSTLHDYTLAGTGGIDGSTGLTLDAANTRTLTLATLNSYSGDTTIAGGTLKLGAEDVIPHGAGKGNLIVGGVLDLAGFIETVNGLSGTGTVDNGTSGIPIFEVGGNNVSSSFGGVIQNSAGTLSLAKIGTGTLILTGANTYSGETFIDGGVLQVGDGGTTGSLGTGPITNSAALAFNRSDDLTLASAIGGGGSLIQAGTGTLTLASGASYGGATVISAGTLKLGADDLLPDGSGVGNVTVNGTLDLDTRSDTVNGLAGSGIVDSSGGGTPTLTVGGNGATATFSGIIRNTAGTLNLAKTGGGVQILAGANTFGGTLAVLGGTLALANTTPLDNCSGISLADGTTLRADAVGVTLGAPITLGGAGTTSTINAPTVVGAGGTSPVPFILNGPIGGEGGLVFNGTQNSNAYGTIVLNAAGTYTGDTLMNCSGSTNTQILVHLGIENALPATTVLTMDGGNGTGSGRAATLDLKGFSQTLAGLSNVTRTLRDQRILNTGATAATLNVNNSADFTFSGFLGLNSGSGNFGLTKNGAGEFAATGTNAYTGDTTVLGGTLVLGSANDRNDSSTVTLAATGARLQLDFAGADKVARLVIGTAEQAAGTYGHTDSGATNGGLGVGALDAHFAAGPGTLDVGVASGYPAWAAVNAPTTGDNPESDEDGDGVNNGIEYVLGGTITTNDLGKLPTVATPGGDLQFSFARDAASIDGSTVVEIELGSDLSAWPDRYPVPADAVAANPGVSVVKNVPAGFDTVTLRVSRAAIPRQFARLKVTVAP
jgi:autotransporter-associated beta strand protein